MEVFSPPSQYLEDTWDDFVLEVEMESAVQPCPLRRVQLAGWRVDEIHIDWADWDALPEVVLRGPNAAEGA